MGLDHVTDCDVGWLDEPDLSSIEALARLQLEALRRGWRIRLRNVSPELAELIELVGLHPVLRPGATQAPRGEEAARRAERSAGYREKT